MRGKDQISGTTGLCRRITPAYAGKSLEGADEQKGKKDHPRLCGEKQSENLHLTATARITPAYAGKNLPSRATLWRGKGSPPPMRGKEAMIWVSSLRLRITPAYAGKSVQIVISSPSTKDHPRLCGEKPPDTFGQLTRLGSPPPMRGKGSFPLFR